MPRSDDLFQLIRSLSASEKRYFKLFAAMQRGQKNYLRLFDAIDALEEYDEEMIRERFAGERFVRQLAVAKKYLYDLILKSLRASHTEFDVGVRVHDQIKAAKILRLKGLGDQARRLAGRAVELADSRQRAIPHLEALYWSQVMRADRTASEEAIEEKYGLLFSALDRVRSELEYERMNYLAQLLLRNARARGPEELAFIETCLADPLLTSDERALSLRARILRRLSLAMLHYGRGDLRETLRWLEEEIALIEANPAYLEEHIHNYIQALTSQLGMFRHLLPREEFLGSVELIRGKTHRLLAESGVRSPRIRSNIFYGIYTTLMAAMIDNGEFEQAEEMIPEIEETLQSLGRHAELTHRLVFHHEIAVVYFGLGRYGRALDYVNMILNEPEPLRHRDVSYHARTFQLVLHYELGNLELIPYLVRSAYRFYSTQNLLYKTETHILAFFRKLMRVDSEQRLLAAFRELHDAIAPLRDDPAEQPMFSLFGYVEWLESKLQHRDFAEIVREHAAGRVSPGI